MSVRERANSAGLPPQTTGCNTLRDRRWYAAISDPEYATLQLEAYPNLTPNRVDIQWTVHSSTVGIPGVRAETARAAHEVGPLHPS